jgi:hypothetical protein
MALISRISDHMRPDSVIMKLTADEARHLVLALRECSGKDPWEMMIDSYSHAPTSSSSKVVAMIALAERTLDEQQFMNRLEQLQAGAHNGCEKELREWFRDALRAITMLSRQRFLQHRDKSYEMGTWQFDSGVLKNIVYEAFDVAQGV